MQFSLPELVAGLSGGLVLAFLVGKELRSFLTAKPAMHEAAPITSGNPKNGKNHITDTQLRQAIADQQRDCHDHREALVKLFESKFVSLEKQGDGLHAKLDKLVDTMNHMNVVLSERLSNLSARMGGAENQIADIYGRVNELREDVAGSRKRG
jgi:phage shock protein A